jgi:arylsulfatase A-like enzyme
MDQASQHRNVLVFCVDQMQAYCLGCNGHPVVRTPNIDALAARGVNFRRGYLKAIGVTSSHVTNRR